MGEIHVYPVKHAAAYRNCYGGLTSAFYYDSGDNPLDKRIPANPEDGIRFYQGLLKEGTAVLGSPEVPNRSPSVGVIYIMSNGKFFSHRRDKDAPTHKLQHSIQIGYPACKRQTRYPSEVVAAEGAELILVTKEKPHRIIIPKGDPVARTISLDLARTIGVNTEKPVEALFHYDTGHDTIEIYEDGRLVSRTDGYSYFIWESEVASNIVQRCYIDFDPENILPVDTEGMLKDNKYIHFNRETFLFGDEIKNKKFGDKIENPVVYRSEIINGYIMPVLQEKEPADAPYVFMPDDTLSRTLYGLGIWEGDWLQHFLEFHKTAWVKQK